jgi:ElaB/YqjD/DUF883 family membrane-anchored ribosome-binding protein
MRRTIVREERAAGADGQAFGAATSAIPPERDASDAGGTRDRLIGDLQTLVSHAQEFLHMTSSVSGESIAHVREQLRQSLGTATTTLRRLQADAMERGREVAQRTDSYVHENPWQAIAVGAVAGVAIGMAASSLMRPAAPPAPSSSSSKRH